MCRSRIAIEGRGLTVIGSEAGRPSKIRRTESGRRPIYDSVIPLTPHNRSTAASLLERIRSKQNPDIDDMEQAQELQRMLVLNVKAEIQAVEDLDDLVGWLNARLRHT